MKYDFAAARAVRSKMDSLDVELYNVSSYMVNGESGEQLIELVKQAEKQNKLLCVMPGPIILKGPIFTTKPVCPLRRLRRAEINRKGRRGPQRGAKKNLLVHLRAVLSSWFPLIVQSFSIEDQLPGFFNP